MIHRIIPDATFQPFDVNRRGQDRFDYGLTKLAIERANDEADLIIVGGSNLYEGALGWPWGVHLDAAALQKLRVPLFLLGVGTGSRFASPIHAPSASAVRQIGLLNEYAALSGARDETTLAWLKRLGVTKAKLLGDPATFIFNHPLQTNRKGDILVVIPPRRIWNNRRQLVTVYKRGRSIFRALASVTRNLLEQGEKIVVACNDPSDLDLAQHLFADYQVICPATPEEYFQVLSKSSAVISGRLHTAVVAFSMGLPFLLFDLDCRTNGFVRTYQLEPWSVTTADPGIAERLEDKTLALLQTGESTSWYSLIAGRDQMERLAMRFLEEALASIKKTGPGT